MPLTTSDNKKSLMTHDSCIKEEERQSSMIQANDTQTNESAENNHIATSALYPDRIILTTYPNQTGMEPIPLNWGHLDPLKRGPILASRHPENIKLRNAIGATSGSYSIYHALGVAMRIIPTYYKPDYLNTEPPFDILPNPNWSKIVSFDPFGHLVPQCFASFFEHNIDLRCTASATKAHIVVPEIQKMIQDGHIQIDGTVIKDDEGEINVCKAAIEPAWYLPGVAEKLSVAEGDLRRALFEDTGGMYPELLTRHDMKVFLPPIGGLTVYIFGPPSYLSEPKKKLVVRVHDECNGSDVFGSDICTCRPYLIFGIAECVRAVQEGGAGLIVYFRKEGRALGEVTKYLVYNARKRGIHGDTANQYFKTTENLVGTHDMRFQHLMPDVFHWLGIKKIDRFISMSNMKYDAMLQAGIDIIERVELPSEFQPKDAKVEMTAKIAAGYYTTGKVPTADELAHIKGRNWDDISH
jgi:GTP cyclohydrolase II